MFPAVAALSADLPSSRVITPPSSVSSAKSANGIAPGVPPASSRLWRNWRRRMPPPRAVDRGAVGGRVPLPQPGLLVGVVQAARGLRFSARVDAVGSHHEHRVSCQSGQEAHPSIPGVTSRKTIDYNIINGCVKTKRRAARESFASRLSEPGHVNLRSSVHDDDRRGTRAGDPRGEEVAASEHNQPSLRSGRTTMADLGGVCDACA